MAVDQSIRRFSLNAAFRPARLLAGASLLSLAWIAAPAHAQDESAQQDREPIPENADPDDEGNAIIVTGIRASLERAMDIKRESSGVVDAISAEDIGKFPDTNLAESLQRIPGVSINRVNGEGSQVTVRGFGPQFNLVTVNGRQLATSFVNAAGGDQSVDFNRATSRSFDFNNLASEGVQRLEVYKTGRAFVPSGGIGATINIVTQRPLDAAGYGLRGSVAAKGLYDLSNEDFRIDPEFSGIVTWTDPEDMFGVSLFGAYQKRNSTAASATSNDWNIAPFSAFPGRGSTTEVNGAPSDPDALVAVLNDSRYHYSEYERERINLSGSAQYQPLETLTFTADALFASNAVSEARSDQGNWFNRPFDTITFDNSDTVPTAVFISEGAGYGTKDIGFEQQYRATKTDLYSYGLNAEWEAAPNFIVSLDGNHSISKSRPDASNGASSTLVSIGAPVVDAHSVDYSGEVPQQMWVFDDSGAGTDGILGTADDRGNNNGVLDLGDLGTQVQRTNAASQRQRVDQVSGNLGWEFAGNSRFDIGMSYIDSNMTSARIQTQQTLGDWGIGNVGDVQQLAGDLVEEFCLECQFDHYNVTNAQTAFRGNAVDLYNIFAPYYEDRGNPINVTGNDYDEVSERIFALYAQLTWDGDFMGRPAGLVAGIRFENTNVEAYSRVAQPDRIEWDSDNDFSIVIGDTVTEITRDGEYSNLLPSIDFRIEPADDLVARISYSKTIARADYGNLFASQAAGAPNRPTALGGVPGGNQGNPNLLPLVADNFDASLEWYFAPTSYVSAAFFYKKVKNFVGVGQEDLNLFGLRDPSSGQAGTRSGDALAEIDRLGVELSDVSLFTLTALIDKYEGDLAAASAEFQANLNANGQLDQAFVDTVLADRDVIANGADPLFDFQVQTPINNREGNIHGFELQGQYFFGTTGFGVSGSFTKVYGDVNVDILSDPGTNVYALVGLADSFNVTGIYEQGPLSARVSYNWRDKFLAAVNRGAGRSPVFFEPFGTLDASLTYDLTDNVSLSLDAINILSEPVRSYGRDEKQIWFAQELKPRILGGVRFRF
ncbi:TonB-dependent receptor [Aurantiacibacter spongiae]|uniref:TonB-dependent receptor n=1 Tax=Aurantiacibacter spongiae TaxID=2488860 RepID=A0A3N5CTY9_9SPHN|nr:TonB-dependent receptor [Aurantiacibacter spongiae]RPF72167.1 TonB-dependent receptor [Aurantiacibacter spongiae]